MTIEIGIVFGLLIVSVVLFVAGWIRADIVALLVLVSLAVTGVLDGEHVLEGFSSEEKAFAVAVIVGAAATYLLPVGHPAPLLVQGPGSYQTKDYFRYGIGLVLITLAVVVPVVPLFWPF